MQTHAHASEGFAIGWSPQSVGCLASGDCQGGLHVWNPKEGGSWTVSGAYQGHGDSVEDIHWSPTEATVFATACVDKVHLSHTFKAAPTFSYNTISCFLFSLFCISKYCWAAQLSLVQSVYSIKATSMLGCSALTHSFRAAIRHALPTIGFNCYCTSSGADVSLQPLVSRSSIAGVMLLVPPVHSTTVTAVYYFRLFDCNSYLPWLSHPH